jgi:hypothetical protein
VKPHRIKIKKAVGEIFSQLICSIDFPEKKFVTKAVEGLFFG